jgi:methylmalonyl-CoA/ethylmalonyl-CoA epimerase
MKVKRLQHAAIVVRDTWKFEKLLGETLGLTLTKRNPRNAKNIVKSVFGFEDGSYLELIEPQSREGNMSQDWLDRHGESLFHVALEVEDIHAAVAELKGRGVRFVDPEPRIGGGGTLVAFIDPDCTENVIIELVESRREVRSDAPS